LGIGRSLAGDVLVFLKDFCPVADVVGVVFPDLQDSLEVGTEESGAQLCDQAFHDIT